MLTGLNKIQAKRRRYIRYRFRKFTHHKSLLPTRAQQTLLSPKIRIKIRDHMLL